MFRFFYTREWALWAYLGTAMIVAATAYSVSLDVQINEWFGQFYNMMQKALTEPGAVTLEEFLGGTYQFASIAALYIINAVIFLGFLVNHWTFRWRQSMASYYISRWPQARKIEGASQRLQEDTLKFARIVEDLGIGLLEAILQLGAFGVILWGLSNQITELPWIGQVDHALVWVVMVTALGGTMVLGWVGRFLPGIEYDVQKEEAAYRKELVLGEDDAGRAKVEVVEPLFMNVRNIHFKAYLHYFYFNIAKYSYLQGMVIVPYLAMAPTIVAGAVTLGFVSQTGRAFNKVAESLQYIIRSWMKIVELISVYKRLREFEKQFKNEVVNVRA